MFTETLFACEDFFMAQIGQLVGFLPPVLCPIAVSHSCPQVAKSTKTFEEEFREFLATKTTLNAENIGQTLYFVSGLEKLQQIKNIN